MNELLIRLLTENPDALKGLRVTGTIPLREDLVNEALGAVLADLQKPAPAPSATPSGPSAAAAPALDARAFAPHLRTAKVSFRDGAAVLDFEVRVD